MNVTARNKKKLKEQVGRRNVTKSSTGHKVTLRNMSKLRHQREDKKKKKSTDSSVCKLDL